MSKVKKILKKIIPATYFKVEEEGQYILKQVKKENELLRKEIRNLSNMVKNLQTALHNENMNLKDTYVTRSERTNELLINQYQFLNQLLNVQNDGIKEYIEETTKACEDKILYDFNKFTGVVDNVEKTQNLMKRNIDEIIWAHVFNNSISDNEWLLDKSLSPGRWAMGYVELYVLFRVLNEFKPNNILELGLGQSTRIVSQYVKSQPTALHYVVENDHDWIEFWKSLYEPAENTEIVQLDYERGHYNGVENINVYKGFKDKFEGKKFDLVVIDAPLGSEGFSRIDIISILPECLSSNFVLLLDDAERLGEKKTISEIDKILERNNIKFERKIYRGAKDMCIWTSPELRYLGTM